MLSPDCSAGPLRVTVTVAAPPSAMAAGTVVKRKMCRSAPLAAMLTCAVKSAAVLLSATVPPPAATVTGVARVTLKVSAGSATPSNTSGRRITAPVSPAGISISSGDGAV